MSKTSRSTRWVQYILVLPCLIFFTSTQAQVNELARLPHNKWIGQMWLITRSMGNTKDTVALFNMYDSLEVLATSENDQLMLWEIRLSKTGHQAALRYPDMADRLSYWQSKQAYFEQSPYPVVRGTLYFHLGNTYFELLNFPEAFKFLFRARQLFEQTGYDHIPEAILYLNRFFEIYYFFGDYRTAAHYLALAEKYNTYKLMDDWFVLNNRGVTYSKIQDYTNAKKDFLKTVAIAKAHNHQEYVGIGSGNYGNMLRLERKYREALPYLYKDIALNEKTIPDNTAITCLYLAYSLLQLDSAAKAKTYIDLSQRLHPDWVWSSYPVNYYDVKSLYYRKIGDLPTALVYKDSLVALKDSLRKVFDNKQLMGAEAQITAERYVNQLQTLETEKANAVLRRNVIITAIILIALMIVYLLNQRRKRERQLEEADKKRSDEQLAHATEQLAQYVEHIKSKNALIDRLSLDLVQNQLPSQETTAIETQIDTLRQSVILTENNWVHFRQLFERVYPQFFSILRHKYPDLTPAEIRLLALLKLNSNSKEMAYMLGVSLESIRKARYRLRKKMEQLQVDTDLKGILEQL